MKELHTNHSEMAVFGLIYIVLGLISVFVFIAYTAGMNVPGFLEFSEQRISLLLIAAVCLLSAWGVLSRKKYMWSATITFMVVCVMGNAVGFFYKGGFFIVMIVLCAICGLYLFSTPAKEWYGVQ